MNVSVLGCGRWGSFLAWYMNSLGHNVVSFGRDDESFKILESTRANEYVRFDDNIKLTSDLKLAVSAADIIIVSISSQALREFLKRVISCGIDGKKIVLCMKGIEEGTGKRLSEVAIESGVSRDNLAVWVGPGHIQDFVKGIPNCMVIDSHNCELTKYLADIFKSGLIRFYYGNDIVGTEVGAATKNIMGIVAGVLDGMNFSTMKGPLMARGAREVARLIKALGGNELSAYGLCHLGDYETTLFSPYSHNRMWGEAYVCGDRFNKLAEGVATASAVSKLAHSLKIEMPITDSVNSMINSNIHPKDILNMLLERDIKSEF